MILVTERLILRPWREADAESLYEYAKDESTLTVAESLHQLYIYNLKLENVQKSLITPIIGHLFERISDMLYTFLNGF